MIGYKHDDERTEDMTITLCWGAAESADDTHDDISTDISGTLVGFVVQRDGQEKGWHWLIEDWTYDPSDDIPQEPAVLAGGNVATQQQGRTAVMNWVREHKRSAGRGLVEKYAIEESDRPTPPGTSLWLKFHNYDINVQRTDEGVLVDVWKEGEVGEPVASTYAYDNE